VRVSLHARDFIFDKAKMKVVRVCFIAESKACYQKTNSPVTILKMVRLLRNMQTSSSQLPYSNCAP